MSLSFHAGSHLRRVPVAIIGGGLEAFTTALTLHRGGIPNNVFLRTGTLSSPARANLFIGGSAVRILDRLGLGSDYRLFGTPVRRAAVEDVHGLPIASFALDALGVDVWSVPRDNLLQAIVEALPPDSVFYDAKFRGLYVHGDAVDVKLQQTKDHLGPVIPARNFACRAAVAIGADGSNSAVRTFMSRSIMSVPCGVTLWRAVVAHDDLDQIPLHAVKEIWHGHRRFGYVRTGMDEVMWWAVVTNEEEIILRPFTPHLRRYFEAFPPIASALIDATNVDRDIQRQEMRRVISEQSPWIGQSSRVALIGDAGRAGTAEVFHSSDSFAVEDSYYLANYLIEQRDAGLLLNSPNLGQYHESREEQLSVVDKLITLMRRLTLARSGIGRYLAKTLLHRAMDKLAAEGISTLTPTAAQLDKIPGIVERRAAAAAQ